MYLQREVKDTVTLKAVRRRSFRE